MGRPLVVGSIQCFNTRLRWKPKNTLGMQSKAIFLNKKLKLRTDMEVKSCTYIINGLYLNSIGNAKMG